MAKDKFTVADIDEELRRRSAKAKASLPKTTAKKDYPNADRYLEDGRRLYSAYEAPEVERPAAKPEGVWTKLRRLATKAFGDG